LCSIQRVLPSLRLRNLSNQSHNPRFRAASTSFFASSRPRPEWSQATANRVVVRPTMSLVPAGVWGEHFTPFAIDTGIVGLGAGIIFLGSVGLCRTRLCLALVRADVRIDQPIERSGGEGLCETVDHRLREDFRSALGPILADLEHELVVQPRDRATIDASFK